MKPILAIFIAMALGLSGAAYADKLESKWDATRAKANRLGNLAAGGDVKAFMELAGDAVLGDAASEHNLGWLFERGHFNNDEDPDKACTSYGKAADLGYPPAMHAYGLCALKKSKSSGPADEFEKLGIKRLIHAAQLGWTASSIAVITHVMNRPTLIKEDADDLQTVTGYGYGSRPTRQEKMELLYLDGMTIIYGSRAPSWRYREARDLLIEAKEMGHTAVDMALPMVYSQWAKTHRREAAQWKGPTLNGLACYKNDAAGSSDKKLTAVACAVYDREAKEQLDYLAKETTELMDKLNKQDSAELGYIMELLDEKSTPFRADAKALSDIIKQLSDTTID